ncbi:hypothetical protein LTR22_003536 [Elasticomyces elasticus]|nr:hypothetical protein LTR22_003536 [Elasticomyces elasticus]KAK4930366.1 hypothetical protein LTR49_003107 [Elasticomyces elasticus]KAK5768907.1 hypothetical protein LTS12_000967 [Elasticomyces elasticus]
MTTPAQVFAHLRHPPAKLRTSQHQEYPRPSKHNDMEIDSPLELNDTTEEAPQQEGHTTTTTVFEATFSLHPICFHGRGKVKQKESTWFIRCGENKRCRQAIIKPEPEIEPAAFILTTTDPEQDLRWWLGIRAAIHDQRDTVYVSNERITDEILRSTIMEAVHQLHEHHIEINHLLRYAKRAHNIAPKQNPIKDADDSLLSLSEGDVACKEREELLETLVLLAAELDYLVEKTGIVEATVLKAITKLAEGGSVVERECLWRLGHCDEVDKMI